PGGVARLTLIDGCIENRRFGAVHWRRCGFRLTFDSPSATRADREARPPPLGGHGRGTAFFQGFGNRIVDTFEPDELQLLTRALRNLIEVPPVTRREHHPGEAGRGGGDELSMMPATICMVVAIAHARIIRRAVLVRTASSRTMPETDTTAATAARKVPAALSSSTASALEPKLPFSGSGSR